MKSKVKVKAVIFDMDGVITNTMPDHYRVWKKIFSKCGIHASRLDVYLREGQPGIDSVREIFALNKISYTEESARAVLKRKEKMFKGIVRRRFIVGARRFIRDLHRQEFRLALVTGTSRQELHRILPDYLYGLFDVVVTGSDVRKGKPHPEPFLKALRKLKLKPKEALVIENAPFGIRSAKAAGIRCLALETSLPKRFLQKADMVFQSVKDLRDKIKIVNKTV